MLFIREALRTWEDLSFILQTSVTDRRSGGQTVEHSRSLQIDQFVIVDSTEPIELNLFISTIINDVTMFIDIMC